MTNTANKQLTDYGLELMAKGWVSLNKDKPEHVQEVALAKLLKEIKKVYTTPPVAMYATWYDKLFTQLENRTFVGYCDITGTYSTKLVKLCVDDNGGILFVNRSILNTIDTNDSTKVKIKPDTVISWN